LHKQFADKSIESGPLHESIARANHFELKMQRCPQRHRWLPSAGLAQLLLLALLLWLAVDGLAHKRCHPDADKGEHECAVTLLAQGKADVTTCPPVAVAAPQDFFFLPWSGLLAITIASTEHLHPFACGPPRA
jgi:hypothetical protein